MAENVSILVEPDEGFAEVVLVQAMLAWVAFEANVLKSRARHGIPYATARFEVCDGINVTVTEKHRDFFEAGAGLEESHSESRTIFVAPAHENADDAPAVFGHGGSDSGGTFGAAGEPRASDFPAPGLWPGARKFLEDAGEHCPTPLDGVVFGGDAWAIGRENGPTLGQSDIGDSGHGGSCGAATRDAEDEEATGPEEVRVTFRQDQRALRLTHGEVDDFAGGGDVRAESQLRERQAGKEQEDAGEFHEPIPSAMCFVSRKASMPSMPSSRPQPLCLVPPNGHWLVVGT